MTTKGYVGCGVVRFDENAVRTLANGTYVCCQNTGASVDLSASEATSRTVDSLSFAVTVTDTPQ